MEKAKIEQKWNRIVRLRIFLPFFSLPHIHYEVRFPISFRHFGILLFGLKCIYVFFLSLSLCSCKMFMVGLNCSFVSIGLKLKDEEEKTRLNGFFTLFI